MLDFRITPIKPTRVGIFVELTTQDAVDLLRKYEVATTVEILTEVPASALSAADIDNLVQPFAQSTQAYVDQCEEYEANANNVWPVTRSF